MDDHTPSEQQRESPRSAPSAPSIEKSPQNGRTEADGDDRAHVDRSSSSKPALTDRERTERWPID